MCIISARNVEECTHMNEVLDCRGNTMDFWEGEIDSTVEKVLFSHIEDYSQLKNIKFQFIADVELEDSNPVLCHQIELEVVMINGVICMVSD